MKVADALATMLEQVQLLPTTDLPLETADGRILRAPGLADRDAPPFDRVMMDGFAFAAPPVAGTSYPIQDRVPAGLIPPALGSPGSCLAVMTGGVLPPGCDCVVPVEDTEETDGSIQVTEDVERPRFVDPQGSDHFAGAEVLASGCRLGPGELAVAATEGATSLTVSAAPRVRLISTGDEVVPVAAAPEAHQLRRSHPTALSALVRCWGTVDWRDEHAADSAGALASSIQSALEDADLLMLTGGVSKGQWDLVPELLEAVGVTCLFHGVQQRPGKPLWFGTRGKQLVIGLPGNPVSALCCARFYLWPVLDAMSGARPRPAIQAPLSAPLRANPRFNLFATVRQEADGLVPVLPRNSGNLHALAQADGFVSCPPDDAILAPGAVLPYFPWRS